MSIEWVRARTLENRRRERECAQSIQGADAAELTMVFPLDMTFWGESAAPFESKSESTAAAQQAEKAPTEPNPSHVQNS
jgi:hypothetical protein